VKRSKVLSRARRVREQVDAIERAIEEQAGSSELLQLITAARGALNGLIVEVLEDYIRTHVVDPAQEPDKGRASATELLIAIVRSYLK
jgi:DNA-binding FrmR family transcriptional regulator